MINVTLIIQTLHFGIAYLILDRIFLRKGVAVVQKEDCERISLQRTIDQIAEELAIRTKQKEQEWSVLHYQLQQQIPVIITEPLLHHTMRRTTEEFKPLPEQEITKLAQQMQQLIVRRIVYD